MVPQKTDSLDQRRWTGLWSRLGAEGTGVSIWTRLTNAYAEPGRAYHTAEHIRDCLTQLDLTRHLAQRPDEVEAALWFHDAVYIPGGAENERQSAEMAQACLMESGVPLEVASRVAGLVLATEHVTVPNEHDTQLLCDIDLSILGRQPEVFDQFERRIRREYAWVPEGVYRSSRSEVLEGFLQRNAIYQTDYFRSRYEVQARANLERVLKALAT